MSASSAVPSTATAGPRWSPPTFARANLAGRFGDSGFEAVRQWTHAGPVTAESIEAARRWLADHAAFVDPPAQAGLKRWLAALALQCATKGTTPADAEVKAVAYAGGPLGDLPALCFTKATLDAAVRNFDWFPSAGELVKFLEAETADRRGQLRIAKQTAMATPQSSPTPAARRGTATRLAELAAIKERHGLRPDQPAAAILRDEVGATVLPEEAPRPLYVWQFPDGRYASAAVCPPGATAVGLVRSARNA